MTRWIGYYNQDHAVYYYTPYLWRNGRKLPLPENQGGKKGTLEDQLLGWFSGVDLPEIDKAQDLAELLGFV